MKRLLLLVLVCLLTGCSTTRAPDVRDPWEGWNRGVFAVNQEVDRFVVDPAAVVYRTVVPPVGRDGIHNALGNLSEPVRLLNHLFQGEPGHAGTSLHRLLVNSTVGLGGLIDVAAHNDIQARPTDFGRTLERWGVEPGPYLVVPLLGRSTTRGLGGRGVDYVLDPLFHASDHTLLGRIDDFETPARVLDIQSRLQERGGWPPSGDAYAQRRAWLFRTRGIESPPR